MGGGGFKLLQVEPPAITRCTTTMTTPHARSPSETPHLAAPTLYQQQGTAIAAGSVDCYATGPPDAAACIVLIPGVWGWSGGRVRALAQSHRLVPLRLDDCVLDAVVAVVVFDE